MNRRLQAWLATKGLPNDIDSLTVTASIVLEIECDHKWLSELSFLDAPLDNPEHLATALRASFTHRETIPGFADALNRLANHLRVIGQDPEDMLYGMI